MGFFYAFSAALAARRVDMSVDARRICAILAALAILSALMPSGLRGQRLLMDDFAYPPGDSLTPHGWTSGSSTGPILTSGPGLQFGTYQGSGIGNAAALKSTGQDVQKEFAADSLGCFYVWALVNVSTARAGDYFLHLQPNAGSSVYVGRTYARLASNGGLAFGVAKRGTNTSPTVVYSDSVFVPGITYLLVLKYELKPDSTTDDEVTLYVMAGGEVARTEPWTPAAGPVADATADPSFIGALALRQGEQNRAPALTIDGLRVTRGWDAWLPATLDSLAARPSVEPHGVALSWQAWTEAGVEGYQIDRRYPTDLGYTAVTAGLIPAAGAAGEAVRYSFVDTTVSPGPTAYRLRLRAAGGAEFVADSVELDVPTSADADGRSREIPRLETSSPIEFVVSQSFANPFNPMTLIRIASPTRQVFSLDLYDLLGRHCGRVFHGTIEGGRSSEIPVDGAKLSTGAYMARLTWGGGVAVRKLLIVR